MTTQNQPQSAAKEGIFAHWRADFLASLVVFLVALPLCIGIAVAVGVNPARALITGIIGGLIVGIFAGSPLQVSGPAAGLFVIVQQLVYDGRADFSNPANLTGKELVDATEAHAMMILGAAVFLAGAVQIVAGALRLGQWFRAVSPAVIKGMLAGIGILIAISQFHVMLDHEAMWNGEAARGAVKLLATIPEAILKCFSYDTSHSHHLAALTGIIAMAGFIFWPTVAPKRFRFFPAALVGVILATAFTTIAQITENTLPTGVKLLDVPDNIFSEVTLPTWQSVIYMMEPIVLSGGLVIALVASAETLLCATAVDQMHQGPRTKYDRELSAQGIGNILCGLVAALPMTGVIVRSSANVSSGARTRLSTILHGLWLLIFVAAIPFVLNYIPRSALGALLVYTGFKLVNIRDIRNLWSTSRGEAGIYFATVIMIVSTDLLIGVLVGIALSALKLLFRFSNLRTHLDVSDDRSTAVLQLEGAATFVCLPKLASQLEKVPKGAELHVDFENLTYIDHACLDLLMSWAKQHSTVGGELVLDWNLLHGRFTPADSESSLEGNGRANAIRERTSEANEKSPSQAPEST